MGKFTARVAAILVAWSSVAAQASEVEDRHALEMEVYGWFDSYQFQKIEQAADQYRKTGERTRSGTWKLDILHRAISESFLTNRTEPGFWKGRNAHVEAWIGKYPTSATAHLAYARMLLNKAWSVRGDGLADEVDSNAWQPFYEGTELAAQYLLSRKPLMEHDPTWYELMIIAGYRLSWPRERLQPLLDEALRQHPKYQGIYFAAVDYFAPKWGGSAELVEQFAQKGGEIAKRAGEPGMYARIYWVAIDGQFKSKTFQQSRINWPKMKSAMRELLGVYPDEWNVQNFARFACLAGDREMTAELFSQVRGFVIEEAWRQYAPHDRCKRGAMNPAHRT